MKAKIVFPIILVLLLLPVNIIFSQYLNTSDIRLLNVYTPPPPPSDLPNLIYSEDNFEDGVTPMEPFNAQFDLANISTNRLDIATGLNTFQQTGNPGVGNFLKRGFWNSNSGNGNFSNYFGFYINESYPCPDLNTYYTQGPNKLNGSIFTELRATGKKEFLVVRDNKLDIYWNSSGNITGLVQEIPSGFGEKIDAGSFTSGDNYSDIVVASLNESKVKIYKNNYPTGYLDASPVLQINTAVQDAKIRQINGRIAPYSYFEDALNLNKLDLITREQFGGTIKIFINDNQNGVLSPYTIVTGLSNIRDMEIADLNNDGYNDLLVCGNIANMTGCFGKWQIYLNVNGTISSTPHFTYSTGYCINRLKVADLNSDGLNDFVMVSRIDSYTQVFINNGGQTSFNPIPDQDCQILGQAGNLTDNVRLSDIYGSNTNPGGGIALIFSHRVNFNRQEVIKIVEASNFNPAPAPPIVFRSMHYQNHVFRPKIYMYNRGESDFSKYKIYKRSPSTNNILIEIGETTNNYFIDYSEFLIIEQGTSLPSAYNCFYYVKSVDISPYESSFSPFIGYSVGGIPSCFDCEAGPDNFQNNTSSPEEFSMNNYPNPFNPTTTITYSIPKEGQVKLKVYDIAGKEIKVLVNEFKEVGSYKITFDGSNLSSGIYIYKIESNGFIQTNRMMLTK